MGEPSRKRVTVQGDRGELVRLVRASGDNVIPFPRRAPNTERLWTVNLPARLRPRRGRLVRPRRRLDVRPVAAATAAVIGVLAVAAGAIAVVLWWLAAHWEQILGLVVVVVVLAAAAASAVRSR